MKKLLSIALAFALIMAMLSGCSAENAPVTADPTETVAQSVTETTSPTEAQGIETDENLFTVTITLPASMYEGEDMTSFDFDAYIEENGFIDAYQNEDGSVSIIMSKAKHKELLKETAASLENDFAAFVNATDTPYVKEITHNDDFSSIEIKVVRADYENAWDFTAFSVGMSAMFYQMLLDMEYHIEVSTIDIDTGEIIDTLVLPDALGE